jgi:ERCC4-related helicase
VGATAGGLSAWLKKQSPLWHRVGRVCFHPAENKRDPAASGKFSRLREVAEEIVSRQEKALVFTQFREMTGPLAGFLAGSFGRPGAVLHGATPVRRRTGRVAPGTPPGPPRRPRPANRHG